MKLLFIISLACVVESLIAVAALSAMTIVPGNSVENTRTLIIVIAGIVACLWSGAAFWSRPGQNIPEIVSLKWLSRSLVAIGIVYLIGVFLFIIG
jgi:hypothetical protein